MESGGADEMSLDIRVAKRKPGYVELQVDVSMVLEDHAVEDACSQIISSGFTKRCNYITHLHEVIFLRPTP